MLVNRMEKTITQLMRAKGTINLNPSWQRGPAWTPPRQVLLIDSILREMDFPKIYLRLLSGQPYTYEAVDGQQRLRAIFEFREDDLALEYATPAPPIRGIDVQGKTFSQLPKAMRDRFDNFTVSIGEITTATRPEINDLFARLQMGVSLNPAELRNAIQAPLRDLIDAAATAHDFFSNCKIPDRRYKRQDYVAHAFAMAAYDGAKDIKAPNLKAMVLEYGYDRLDEVQELNRKVEAALTVLADLNAHLGYTITQKWVFVDLCWLIMQWLDESKVIDVPKLAEKFDAFENERRFYTGQPAALITPTKADPAPNSRSRKMYDYIIAFKAGGAARSNLKVRNAAIKTLCR
jgi:Protein of unknown function DUF262